MVAWGHVYSATSQTLLLQVDTVLIAGRDANGTSEVYVPSSGTWQVQINSGQVHCDGITVTLPSGGILIAGGTNCSSNNALQTKRALYQPKQPKSHACLVAYVLCPMSYVLC